MAELLDIIKQTSNKNNVSKYFKKYNKNLKKLL